MKKRLFSIFAVLAAFGASLFSNAQTITPVPDGSCGVTNIGVEVLGSPGSTPTTCNATVNLNIGAVLTGGNQRTVAIRLYNRSGYPNLNFVIGQQAPAVPSSASVLATITLQRANGGESWSISSITNGAGTTVNSANVQLVAARPPQNFGGLNNFYGNYAYFKISNLVLTVPGSCANLNINQFTADVWGTNNNSNVVCFDKNVSLVDCGVSSTNVPIITGVLGSCNTNPRTYSVTINNAGNCRPFFVDYKVYLDANNNGVRDAGDPQINSADNDGDVLFDNVAVLLPGRSITTPLRPVPGLDQNDLFIEGTFTTLGANNAELIIPITPGVITNECAPIVLPVKFKAFSAQRNSANKQLVELVWETVMEQNNKGFQVQRKTGGQWQTVAFVPTAAENGNSTQALRYRFVDNNTSNGLSQYRLLQEDLDGSFAYSDEKAVRGLTQAASVIVFPNPAVNGTVNLLFAETGNKEVIVSDMSGRIVKQYREVAQNNLKIQGLSGGFYTIKIIDRKSEQVSVEKVVVK